MKVCRISYDNNPFQLRVPKTLRDEIDLVPWELHVYMNDTLNKFIVTNFSLQAAADSKTICLVISLQRLEGPFWISLFVPSMCLILAAEIAMFVDETHFEAMIMVALTSNLVMYTLYSAIQAKLPENSSYKLIDFWMLHGLLMPMVVFIVLAINELLNSKLLSNNHFNNKKTRVANSSFKTKKIKQSPSINKKMENCMALCKFSIPVISVLFMIIFFIACLNQ